MARKSVLTKEQIIEEAFHICQVEGLSFLTLRKIAANLGTSTAPIYTQYKNLDLLMNDLDNYVENKLLESTREKRTHDSFLNIGVGKLAFVLENQKIFIDFYLNKQHLDFNEDNKKPLFLEQMKENPYISIIGDERLTILLEDMWIYTYGLATLICTSINPPEDLTHYIHKLQQTGNKMIQYHLYSSGKYEEYLQLIMNKVGQHINLEEVFGQ